MSHSTASFRVNNPIYRCWTKATTSERGLPRRSLNWILARRDWFKIYSDRIKCGDWLIPVDQIVHATVYRGHQMLIPFTILKLETEDQVYQFGFNPWANPIKHLPLSFEEEHIRLGFSPFSVAIRIILILFLLYLILDR
jgi:hypothetical protein